MKTNHPLPKTARQRMVLLGAIGILLVGGVAVIRVVKDVMVFKGPVDSLPGRQEKLTSLGAVLKGKEFDHTQVEFWAEFDNVQLSKELKSPQQAIENSRMLLEDKKFVAVLKSPVVYSAEPITPCPKDFLYKQNAVGSKRAASSMRTYVRTAIAEDRIEDAIRGCEFLFAMQNSLTGMPSEEAIVFWFGVNTDLAQQILVVSQMSGLTDPQKGRLVAMLSPESNVFSLQDLAVRQCGEMVALTRGANNIDEDIRSSLYNATSGNHLPASVGRKEAREAMESVLLSGWIQVLSAYQPAVDPEFVGVEMDRISMELTNRVSNYETDYMLLAMPNMFEQFGRMTMRVLQARAALLMAMTKKLEAGHHTVHMSGLDVELNVVEQGGMWVVTTPNSYGDASYNTDSGLEINQQSGIRLFVKK